MYTSLRTLLLIILGFTSIAAFADNPIIGISGTFVFDTKPPIVNLLSPNGGQTYAATQFIPVTWTATDEQMAPNPVKIGMSSSQNGAYTTLLDNLPNSGNHGTQPLCVSTQYGRIQISVKDLFGNIGHDESNNYFTVIANNFIVLTADFIASTYQPNVGEQLQFTDASLGTPMPNSWQWNFGDGICFSNQNPTHSFSASGTYLVTLKVGNGTGTFSTKTKSIEVGSNNYGIVLNIVDTKGIGIVKYAGYYYGFWSLFLKDFPVINDTAKITFDLSNPLASFLVPFDKICFFDAQKKQIGHIAFKYDSKLERNFPRNAIIILHNDIDMCNGNNYPYDENNPFYSNGMWDYYKKDEYPVTMLIPPYNKFLSTFIKPPVLFVHGVSGCYNYFIDSEEVPRQNKVSYWYTTPALLNDKGQFDGWQFYYPYDSDIEHLGKCLKVSVDNLKTKYNQKIRLVTHSMGGLVTMEYLTAYSGKPNYDSRQMIEKVLFLTPPLHGSLSAVKLFKTTAGFPIEFLFGKDREAPAYNDLSLGSNFIVNLNKKNWTNFIDLNGNGDLSDDYFVVLGTTQNNYPTNYFHIEAYQHADGLVSISSGSLLDQGINYATIHGNHNDGKCSQSNISDPDLIPRIINSYFLEEQNTFYSELYNDNNIKSIVKSNSNNPTVFKPVGSSLANLNLPPYSTGENDVNYQKGDLQIEINSTVTPFNNVEQVTAFYNSNQKILELYPYSYGQIPGMRLIPIYIRGFSYIGTFKKNMYNTVGSVFYYKGYFNGQSETGCAINLVQDGNIVKLMDENYNPIIGMAKSIFFKYCQTNSLTYNSNITKTGSSITNNQTDSKSSTVLTLGQIPSDSIHTFFFVDDQSTLVKFDLSSLQAYSSAIQLNIKMKMPDGVVIDSSFSGGTYSNDTLSGVYEMSIANPMVGRWKIWAESNYPGADTMEYSAAAYLMSDIYAYLINDTAKANVGNNFQIIVGLQMDTLSLSDSLVVKTTVTKSNGDTLMYNMSASKTSIDSAYKFTHAFLVDTSGYYSIKINYDGVYNGHRFERVLFHQFEAIDTTVSLKLPDVQLTELSNSSIIDLRNYAFNYDCPYDSLTFIETILSSNIDSTVFSHFLNDTTRTANFSSNLSDTGTVVIKYSMHLPDNNVVRDTITVHVLLPDLKIMNQAINKSIVYTDSTLIASCQIKNQGNTYAGSFQVKYFLSADAIYNPSDIPIGERTINNIESDSTISISDTLMIPSVTTAGNYYLIFVIDADNIIKELNDSTNNLASVQLQVKRLPILTLKLFLEGLFNPVSGRMNKAQDSSGTKYPGKVADLVSISLANASPPYTILKTYNNVELDTNGITSITIPQTFTGTYYIVVKHRNSLETWSIVPITIDSLALHFDFTLSTYSAFGNNLKNIGTNYLIYGGDVNQDGATDALDMILVGNAKATGVIGYTITDLNGDGVVNNADLILLQNNASSFIMRKKP